MLRLKLNKYRYRAGFLIFTGLWLFASFPSFAACTNPAGQKSDFIYNKDHGVMQYCDDTNWIAMGRDDASVPPVSGLVGHWKLDESSGTTAADSSGNGNNGTLTNMDGGTDWVAGKLNNALDFDGVDDYTKIPNSNASLRFTGNGTTSSWVKLNPTFSSTGYIFLKQSDAATTEWGMYSYISGSRKPNISIVHTDGGNHQHDLTSSSTLNINEWYHITTAWESPFLKIYINGILTDSLNVGTGTLRTGTNRSSSIGAKDVDGAIKNYFDGIIDDVRVYNRELSDSEVGQIYCAGALGKVQYNADSHFYQYCSNQGWTAMGPDKTGQVVNEPNLTSGLVLHWKMNETSGTTVSDSSGNGNTGTLVNGPVWTAGKLNNAVDLDGTDDYINGPDNAGLDFGSGDFTVSTWYKKQTATVGWDDVVGILKWNTGASPGTNEWTLSIGTQDSDAPGFSIESGTTSYSARAPNQESFNQWHHLVGMRDGTDIKVYVDGVLKKTTAVGNVAVNNVGRNVKVGELGAIYSNAVFDDVRIYNRALTPAEIALLAQGPVCSNPTAPEGQMIYNSDNAIMQYCNGKDWVGIGK